MSSVRKSSGIVGIAVIGSRIFGLIRELVFAAMFGPGKLLDSYLAAFQIPNLMRDLFAEGALSTAFTTTFTRVWETDGEKRAWTLVNLLVSAIILLMGIVCILGIIFSPVLIHLTNFGFHAVPGKFELTVQLTRILFPFILFVSLASVVMGALNARFVFGLPASASTVFNITSVVSAVGLAYLFEPQADWRHPDFTQQALYGVSIGVLIGGMAQLGVQLPALFRLGCRFRWTLDLRNPLLRQVWHLMWPTVIAGAAVQVNVLINGMFASEIDGARSWLNCAFRFMQFPIGVFGVAIATATLPAVARHHARQDMKAFGNTVEESLRLALFLTIPAASGLCALAPDLIRVIYEHGKFTSADTAQTAAALRAYTVGLAGYAAIKVLVPCFNALNQPRVPLKVSLWGIVLNLCMNIILIKVFHFGHVGLAMTTGALALVNFVQLVFHLRRHIHFGTAAAWSMFMGKVIIAAAASGAGAYEAAQFASSRGTGFPGAMFTLGLGVAAGAAVYFPLAQLLRIHEAGILLGALSRRLRRG